MSDQPDTVVVPREPTEAMISAFRAWYYQQSRKRIFATNAKKAWSAMISQAPAAGGGGVDPKVRRLVIAARAVAFGDNTGAAAIKELDAASEAFAETVPWDDDPELEGLALTETICAEVIAAKGGEWRPIETAPRDGTYVILAEPDGSVFEGRLTDGGWYSRGNDASDHWGGETYPDHWMPLPAAPALSSKVGE
ncbi:hypothetical protein ASG17_07800 [Brevundimonas sp. Leaf363]|uniref:hypothetical protein n=1 Tax=Brevundimonas sp. Leaf363 TaxID=1736353 RepID=UPI0006FB81B3|nr:hypothetical protein [Brevundimonas sp. Leaf363]KQS55946.1 hypothetical protein ASG17_07800 [Brevundimonas sp. Leaf363]